MCEQSGVIEVLKISSQGQILLRTVDQILEEFGVPRVRGIAKSNDFIQKLDALFNQDAVFENVIDCRFREVKYDKEVLEKEWVVALTRACALRFRKWYEQNWGIVYTLMLFSVECLLMRGEGFLASRWRGRCRRVGAGVVFSATCATTPLSWSALQNSRQVGDATDGYHQGHANNETSSCRKLAGGACADWTESECFVARTWK